MPREVKSPEYQSCLSVQHGGHHYKNLKIQPVELAYENKLCFRTFCASKYMMRHDKPGGEGSQDIRKAIHYLQILLEQEYKQFTKFEILSPAKDEEDRHDEIEEDVE